LARLVCAYLDGALADAPALTLLGITSASEAIAAMAAKYFFIGTLHSI
jgi:hypothetical protein